MQCHEQTDVTKLWEKKSNLQTWYWLECDDALGKNMRPPFRKGNFLGEDSPSQIICHLLEHIYKRGNGKKTLVVLVSYPVLEKKEIDANNNGWRSIYIAFEKYQSNSHHLLFSLSSEYDNFAHLRKSWVSSISYTQLTQLASRQFYQNIALFVFKSATMTNNLQIIFK